MLSKREKIMLYILAWFSFVACIFIFTNVYGSGMDVIKRNITELEQKIDSLSSNLPDDEKDLLFRSKEIREELELEKSRFYKKGEMDDNTFGSLVRDMLIRFNLEITSAKKIAGTSSSTEFTVSGNAYDFFSFLKQVSLSPKYWKISFMSLKTLKGDGNLNVVFRIGYEQID